MDKNKKPEEETNETVKIEVEDQDTKMSSIYDTNIGLPVFPSQFQYMVRSNYEILSTIKTAEEAEEFINDYSTNSCSEWRVLRTYTKNPINVLYKRAWRCQYNVQQRRRKVKDINRIKSSKNCQCPGFICIAVYTHGIKKKQAYSSTIKLNLDHNHGLNTKDVLRYRTLDPSIKDKIINMFQYGHGASAAIKIHLLDLLLINEDQYFSLLSDGKYKPSVSQIQHYLNNIKKDLQCLQLKDIIEDYLFCNPEAQIRYFFIQSEVNKVITIITPLMRKVHQHISRSGDLVSISISPNINRLGIRLVTLSTHCALGTLPLGLLIIQQSGEVPGQKSNVLAETLHEFRSHLPEDVFYGRGYPQVILTENALVPTVSAVWTQSTVLVSQSSVLHSVWKWLQDPQNAINFTEREGFYFSFKKIMFSKTAEECRQQFSALVQYCSESFINYLKFIETLMPYKYLWTDYHRSEKLKKLHLEHIQLEDATFDQSRVEILSSYVYDQILSKIKNLFYSLPEVLDFVINHFETYYYMRMLKFINNNFPKSMLSKYLEHDENPGEFSLQMSDYDKDCYFVMFGDVYHYVDYKFRLCSCNSKSPASPCAHMNAVLDHMYRNSEYAVVEEAIQATCRLLLNDYYSNVHLDDKSIIVINTYSSHWRETTRPDVSRESTKFLNESDNENEEVEYVTLTELDEKPIDSTGDQNQTTLKRKHDQSNQKPRELTGHQIPASQSIKLESLESIVRQFPEVFSGAVIQKTGVGSQEQAIFLQNRLGGDEGVYTIAQDTSQSGNGVFDLSDNVIIIDPKLRKVDKEEDEDVKRFERIYRRIMQNPSNYKTVMRNMIEVYDAICDDVES